ncbi:MAG: hypothetical protein V4805_16320 [Pseudomonadota bacterium]
MVLLPIWSVPAAAVVNAMDPAPGATVFYPYFEVDLANSNGATTVMTLVNTSATAILGNVTIWSDWGTPVHQFPIYLTGYDVASWDMRNVLNGVRPQSASDGQDPTDAISKQGHYSQDINFASCTSASPTNAQLPLTTLGAGVVADIRAALTGTAVTNLPGITAGSCVSNAYGDQIARGYVTIDTENNCTTKYPSDSTYFTDDITHQNVMWGDYMLINPAAGTGQGGLATMLESRGYTVPFASGDYTYYGRFNGFTATDQREALSSHWIIHGDTDFTKIVAWRDPKTTIGIAGATCGTLPANQPLATDYANVVWFDSFPDDLTATAAFGSPLSKLAMSSTAPLSMPSVKKTGFFALGLDHTVAGVPTVGTQAVAQSMVLAVRQPRTGGLLGSRAMAFPVQQVMTPNAGFGRVIHN